MDGEKDRRILLNAGKMPELNEQIKKRFKEEASRLIENESAIVIGFDGKISEVTIKLNPVHITALVSCLLNLERRLLTEGLEFIIQTSKNSTLKETSKAALMFKQMLEVIDKTGL